MSKVKGTPLRLYLQKRGMTQITIIKAKALTHLAEFVKGHPNVGRNYLMNKIAEIERMK